MSKESNQPQSEEKLETLSKLTKVVYSFMSGLTGLLSSGLIVFVFLGLQPREYPYCLLLLLGIITIFCGGIQWCFLSKEPPQQFIQQLCRYVSPIVLCIISVGVCLVVWANTSGIKEWQELTPNIITGVAGIVGGTFALLTLIVNYKTNEKKHKNDLKIENDKRDYETIKALNERLHNILENRNSKEEKVRASSYFQLAGLHKDWELLGKNSEIIKKQRATQQKYILKLIFGASLKEKKHENNNRQGSLQYPFRSKDKVSRSFLEIRNLNSVIVDIFPKRTEDSKSIKGENDDLASLDLFDFKYMNFSKLDFSERSLKNIDFSGADFSGAILTGTDLSGSSYESANLRGIKADKDTKF
ncbi:pentapeptide repeat-containing protein [Rothia sp. P13129]|uniref:pentapeptide repeat-containing protein n=1 Tax=Rothia sp. P13129 TaxID=3402664 RepID=UPI003AD48242